MNEEAQLDRRVVFGFMALMFAMNAVVLLVPWKDLMAGKNDFPPFYASAQMVREGQAARLYDFAAENSFIHRVSDVTRPPNNHLPYELLIFVPFTYFQFGVAHILWTLLSMGMLVGVAMLTRDLRLRGTSFLLNLLTVVAFFPVWYCLLQGQDSILLVLLFALSFWLWRRGQDDVAGFVLALGLFRPQLVLPFVLVAFLGGKWKFVRGFVPGAVFVVGLSTWIVGFHGMADYGRILISQGIQGSASILAQQWHVWPGLMPTLRGLLWIALPSWAAGKIENFLLLSGTLTGLLWAAKKIRSAKDEAAFDLAFGMAVAAVTLVSFHSFLNDFSLMILPLLIAGAVVVSPARFPEKHPYSIVTLGFLFFLTPLYPALLLTDRVGLFVLPTVAFLLLMSSWQKGSLAVPAVDHRSAGPISLRAV
jgi:hypothetical protein